MIQKRTALYQLSQTQRGTDSELTDEDVIIRYAGNEVVGVTILHASER